MYLIPALRPATVVNHAHPRQTCSAQVRRSRAGAASGRASGFQSLKSPAAGTAPGGSPAGSTKVTRTASLRSGPVVLINGFSPVRLSRRMAPSLHHGRTGHQERPCRSAGIALATAAAPGRDPAEEPARDAWHSQPSSRSASFRCSGRGALPGTGSRRPSAHAVRHGRELLGALARNHHA